MAASGEMTLYHSPDSSSAATFLAASAAGLKLKVVNVDVFTKAVAEGGSLADVSVPATLPALRLADGTLLTQNASCLQAVAQAAPGSGLLPPADSTDRLLVQDWLSWTASELHTGAIRPFFFGAPAEEDTTTRGWLQPRLEGKFAALDKLLANTTGFLVGKNFTVADAYLFTVLTWTPALPNIDLSKYPNAKAYHDRIAALDFVKVAQAKMAAKPLPTTTA